MTDEMKDIINSPYKHIIVESRAGSGKSTTIREYIKAHPQEKILYLVFSAEMKREAEKNYKGLNNCEIRTIHSLAYRWWVSSNKYTRYLGMDNLTIMKQLRDTSQLEIRNILSDCDLEYEHLQKIYFYYNMFLCSNKQDVMNLKVLKEDDSMFLPYVKRIYEYHRDNYVPVPHNFYLKQFSLTNPKMHGFDTITLDECLDGDMYVKTDKGALKIRSIHNRMLKGEKFKALSFNHSTEAFEMEDITGSKETLNRDIFEIKTEGLNKLRCTDNHRVLTQFGYVEVKDLIIGKHQLILDNTFNQKTKYKLNDDQLSVFLGSYLGDGHADKRSEFNSYRLKFTQGKAQLDYLKMKSEMFNMKKITEIKSGYTGRMDVYQSDYSNTFILDYDVWDLIKSRFDEKALAIWFMDDGSYSKSRKDSMIHCNNLSDLESDIMKNILESKFDIFCSVGKNKGYNHIYINKTNTRKLIERIKEYVHPDLEYKLGDEKVGFYKWDSKFKNYGGNYISSITKCKVGSVYDISVNKNHNFVTVATNTNKKTSGIVVHNCQDINDASLNIITASNLDKKIIAVGDSAQSIFNFMHCKNALRILKNKYGFKEYKLTLSFRVSDKVADMCSRLLKWFYEEDMSFRGNNKTEIKSINYETIDEQVTILSRTRLGALLEVLTILDKREDAKFYYYGGLEKYDLDKIENMMKYDGFIFIDNQRYHVNTLRKMVKEGLDDPIIKGIISRYDFIKKHKNSLKLLKATETKNIKDADFCLNTLHGCKGSTYEIVKFADDIGGVSNLKTRYSELKEEEGSDYSMSEVENSLNLLYVGMSRATKLLDIGKSFVKEDKLGTVDELDMIMSK
ncbi:MAG: UvrD-helicase domain-containing protein [Cetobacterium sp.]